MLDLTETQLLYYQCYSYFEGNKLVYFCYLYTSIHKFLCVCTYIYRHYMHISPLLNHEEM